MQGRILFNGNIGSPTDLAARAKPYLLGARPGGGSPQALLITAAWGAGEFGEGPVRAALNGIGIASDWQGGHDQRITNLSAWHTWQHYLARHPAVAAVAAEVAAVREATRRFYIEKTSFHAGRIRAAAAYARDKLGGFSIGDLPLYERDALVLDAALGGRALLHRALTRELVHDLADLAQNDRRMLTALGEAEAMLPARTGLHFDPDWQRQRAVLAERILRADAVLLFGGDPDALLGALRFYDLGPALHETLRRGATLVSISAGSLVLCERMIIYDDYAADPERREFRLHDRGLGLVSGLQILPHCMDRIHTDDADNLAYLARRFASHVCVGLNRESFLLYEPGIPRATSVGEHDAVYEFGVNGVKRKLDTGQAVLV